MTSDLDLLGQFARLGSQDAFATLVQRHVNLVYTAALRQVRSPQLAEEISQSVFADLARNAGKISGTGFQPVNSVAPWLYAVTRRTAIDVIRKESRRQLREQIAVEMNTINATPADWARIEPLLDDALAALDETDRSAIVLRYFENKSLSEVGEALGTNDDAAQKRFSRAVERLREFFIKRKIAIGAGSLTILISTHAVQAAPAGLAVSISATAFAGAAAITSTVIASTTKNIAMTTFQKTLVTATVAVLAGAGIYEARQAMQLRDRNQILQQQQEQQAGQIQQLQTNFADSTNQVANLLVEIAQLKSNPNQIELLKLRGEVTRLRNQSSAQAVLTNELLDTSNPLWKPNWIVLRPVDLSQFPDSDLRISTSAAKNVGISTPIALLQTWLWAQTTGDAEGMLKTWDFPGVVTDEQKRERILEAQRDEQQLRNDPNSSRSETIRLRELFDLGGSYYLAFIEEVSPTTGTWISYQFFRHIGDEWRVSLRRNTN